MKISRKKNIQLKTRPTEGKLPTYVSYENNKFHHLYVVCMINFLSNFQLKVVGVSQDLFNVGTDTILNTVECYMNEFLISLRLMKRVQSELVQFLGEGNPREEADIV